MTLQREKLLRQIRAAILVELAKLYFLESGDREIGPALQRRLAHAVAR